MSSRRFLVTAAQSASSHHRNFLNGLKNYANINDSEIIILPCIGKDASEDIDQISPELMNMGIETRRRKLNSNIQIEQFNVRPYQIDPLVGLERFAQRGTSTVFASPKQRLKAIPHSNFKLPKFLITTGAVTRPNYATGLNVSAERRRLGNIATRDHVYGGVVIEIEDDFIFHLRNIRANSRGSFVDLGEKFDGDKTSKTKLEALVLGDWHTGYTDETVAGGTYDMIETLEPSRLVIHDLFDGHSVSHHRDKQFIHQHIREGVDKGFTNLAKELESCRNQLLLFHDLMKGREVYLVACNHHEFLNRYLDESRYTQDAENARMAFRLASSYADGKDPVEEGINLFGKLPNSIRFLKRDEDLKIRGYQLSSHGDRGPGGCRGSIKSKENDFGRSITGHCFSQDTEILTKVGWKFFEELTNEDLVATMNQEDFKLEWQSIIKFFKYTDYNELYKIKGRYINLLVTGDHNLFYLTEPSKRLMRFKAKDFNKLSQRTFIKAIESENIPKFDKNFLKFIVWILADGSIEEGSSIRWHFRKERKIIRLIQLLNDLKLNFTKIKQSGGTTKIRLCNKDSKSWINLLTEKKIMPEWFRDLSKEEANIILEEYSHTDGTKYRDVIQISTSKKLEADIIQQLCVTNGIKCSFTIRKRKNINHKPNYVLCVDPKRSCTHIHKKSVSFKKVKYDGYVWCIEVPNHTLLVRRQGNVILVGNSHSAMVMRDTYVVGCSMPPVIFYNKGSPTNWTPTHMALWETGTVQYLNVINKKWRLDGTKT